MQSVRPNSYKMFKTSIVQLLNLRAKSGGCVITGIRHNCNIPAIVMNNGNEMPILGLGTWSSTPDYAILEKPKDGQKSEMNDISPEDLKSSQAEVAKLVDLALDAGYRHIDCAHLYKNEKYIGEVIKKKINDGLLKREDLFITSKLWNTFHDPAHVCDACSQTLADLGLDYLDMYLMHSPMGFQGGSTLFPTDAQGQVLFSNIDYRDTWNAMEALVDKEMCKNIGISNFNQQQVECLLRNCRIRPQTLQIELHPYLSQKEMVHYAKCNDICVTAYASLGSGNRPWMGNERIILKDYKVLQMAKRHERSPAQILLRYQIQLGLAAIPKPSQKSHIDENIMIFDFELCPEDMLNLESLNHNLRYFQFSGSYGHPYHPFQ